MKHEEVKAAAMTTVPVQVDTETHELCWWLPRNFWNNNLPTSRHQKPYTVLQTIAKLYRLK